MARAMAECLPLPKRLKRGFDWVWLGVWERNFKAQNFYKQFSLNDLLEHHFIWGSCGYRLRCCISIWRNPEEAIVGQIERKVRRSTSGILRSRIMLNYHINGLKQLVDGCAIRRGWLKKCQLQDQRSEGTEYSCCWSHKIVVGEWVDLVKMCQNTHLHVCQG